MALLMSTATIVILFNLIADIAYGYSIRGGAIC
jgi:hypothetical protein